MYKICTVLSQLSVCRLSLRAYPFKLLTMHLDSLVLLSALGVLYSLAVVLKEFDRPIRSDSAGNSSTVYFFPL